MSSRPFASTHGFAVSAGERSTGSGTVTADQINPHGSVLSPTQSRWLLASVEPVEPSPHAWAIAEKALVAMRAGFAAAHEASAAHALARGFASANMLVRAENRTPSGPRGSRRVLIGLSAATMEGDRLIVAHVPPGQTLLCQDRLIYSIPPLQSWEPHYGASDRFEARPLGAADQIEPKIFQSHMTERDAIVLCSTSLARTMAMLPELAYPIEPSRDPQGRPQTSRPIGHGERPLELDELGSFRPAGTDPAEAWIEWLDQLAIEHGVAHCHGVGATIGELRNPAPPRGRLRPGLGRGGSPHISPTYEHWTATDRSADHLVMGEQPVSVSPPVTAAASDGSRATSDGSSCIPARNVGLGVLPGAHGVHRYQNSIGSIPEEWRSRLPRVAIGGPGGIPRWAIIVLAGIVLATTVAGTGYIQVHARAERATQALTATDVALGLAQANDANQPDHLHSARNSLLSADANGAPADDIASRHLSLMALEDEVTGIRRLSHVSRVGGLPDVVVDGKESANVKLVSGPDGVYLVAERLFRLSRDGQQLLQLLQPGDMVADEPVGALRDVVATRSGMVTTDGQRLFTLGPSGLWQAERLTMDIPISADAFGACAMLDGQLAVLDEESGRLLIFDTPGLGIGGEIALPPSLSGSDLGAIDLVATQGLHALLPDGRLVSYRVDGSHTETTLAVEPPINDPKSVDGTADAVWVLDSGSGEGRLVRYDPSGGEPETIVLPGPAFGAENHAAPLANVRDFAIDEASNRVFFLTDSALWISEMPPLDS